MLIYFSALLTFDCVDFNKYLDTVLAASSPPPGSTRQNQSPWLFLDAANTIFETAKRRVYTGSVSSRDLQGRHNVVPESLHPVLEELPKWELLSEILEEIERDNYFNPTVQDGSNGSILIMCGDQATCRQLREYLQAKHLPSEEKQDDDQDGDNLQKSSATFMMRRKLRNYLNWKRDFQKVSANFFSENQKSINGGPDSRNAQTNRAKAPPNKRRRVRGGAAAAAVPERGAQGIARLAGDRDNHIASLLAEVAPTELETLQKGEVGLDPLDDMEDYFELYEMNDLIVVHPYEGDMDEHILEELKPRYVIMYEPDAAFIRRIEVYRSSHTDRNVRVYFMYYAGSVEEQRYLSTVRREKDAFTKMIRERGVR